MVRIIDNFGIIKGVHYSINIEIEIFFLEESIVQPYPGQNQSPKGPDFPPCRITTIPSLQQSVYLWYGTNRYISTPFRDTNVNTFPSIILQSLSKHTADKTTVNHLAGPLKH